MNSHRKQRLVAAGFKVSSADEFLGLSNAERSIVTMRLNLARAVRNRRLAQRCSQHELARRLGSSQSRIAKLEAAEPNVSLDLLVRALLATGAEPKEIGRALVTS